jgi:hypothetical protein
MNNKLITHEMALARLKDLELSQRLFKAARSFNFRRSTVEKASECQQALEENKIEINVLLSIIHWHKMAKKMFFELNEKKE